MMLTIAEKYSKHGIGALVTQVGFSRGIGREDYKTIAWQEPDMMLLLAWSRHYYRFVGLDGSTTRDVWEGRHYFICDEASFWELHCNPERKCSLLPDRQNVGSIRKQIVRIFSQLFGSNSKLWVLWVCFQYVITLRGFLASQPLKNLRTSANTRICFIDA